MNPKSQSEEHDGCSEVLDEDLLDYEDDAERINGKYRCRDCGMIFDTLEEHDRHRRTVHGRVEVYPLSGMLM